MSRDLVLSVLVFLSIAIGVLLMFAIGFWLGFLICVGLVVASAATVESW